MSNARFFIPDEQYRALREKYPKFNEPWTDEETELLGALCKEGVARTEISSRLGRSPGAIRERAKAKGFLVAAPGKKWTEEEESALVDMYHEGVSLEEIAALSGRSVAAIVKRLVLLRERVL